MLGNIQYMFGYWADPDIHLNGCGEGGRYSVCNRNIQFLNRGFTNLYKEPFVLPTNLYN